MVLRPLTHQPITFSLELFVIDSPYKPELEAETRKSRYRHRSNPSLRKHPIEADIHLICDFVEAHRKTFPGAWEAVKAVHYSVDTAALRLLIRAVLEGGSHSLTELRRCRRLESYCNVIESAVAV